MSHTYVLLKWRGEIPTCFLGASLELTNDIKAHLVMQRALDANPESSSQRTLTEGASLTAPVAMIGPELIASLGEFMAKCQKRSPVHTGSEY